MATYRTVGSLKDDISGLLSGLNLSNVKNLYGAIERAARTISQKAYIPEASGKQTYQLYSGVYDYPAPSTIFGGTFVDFRPQGASRQINDYVYYKLTEVFDRTKAYSSLGYSITFEDIKGVSRMRVSQSKTRERIMLDTMSSLSDSTNWVASGDASGLTTDETNYYQTPASLKLNLATAGSSGILTKTKSSVSDLTDYEGVGVAFLATYIPTSVTPITSITLRIGNDSSNYFSVAATEGFLGDWTADEWQLTSFDFAGATETGSVDITKIDYMSIVVAYNGTAVTNLRFGSLWISLPSPHELLFQSDAIFSSSGVISRTITNDNDEIILYPNAYNLFEYECALTIAKQQGGGIASSLIQTLEKDLYGTPNSKNDLGLYAMYRADNPSESIKVVGSWYE